MTTTNPHIQNQHTSQHFSSKNPLLSTSTQSVSNPITKSKTTTKNQDNNQQINYDAHQGIPIRWGCAAASGGRTRPEQPETPPTPVDLVSRVVEAPETARGWSQWC
jgi:hypothetical protein